jgi:hypothetical protein
MTREQRLLKELNLIDKQIADINEEMELLGDEWRERYEELDVELGSLGDLYNDTVDMYNTELDRQLITDKEKMWTV